MTNMFARNLYPDTFEAFWKSYPRKRMKGEAHTAFRAALKRGFTAEQLTAGALRLAIERKGKPPEFTPYPASWLNGDGCLDEPEPPQTEEKRGRHVHTFRASDHPEPPRGTIRTIGEILATAQGRRT